MKNKAKNEIRKSIRSKLTNIHHREEKELQAQQKAIKQLSEFNRIFCYVSTNYELETLNLISKLEDKEIAVPRVTNGEMQAVLVNEVDEMEGSFKGIPQPGEKEGLVLNKRTLDAVIVPGLAFDVSGSRIGYGGGYYDRYLEGYKGEKIGLCFEEQILPNLPQDNWDIKMDQVITNSEVHSNLL